MIFITKKSGSVSTLFSSTSHHPVRTVGSCFENLAIKTLIKELKLFPGPNSSSASHSCSDLSSKNRALSFFTVDLSRLDILSPLEHKPPQVLLPAGDEKLRNSRRITLEWSD